MYFYIKSLCYFQLTGKECMDVENIEYFKYPICMYNNLSK